MLLKRVAKEFCLCTSTHGFKFIVLPQRILLERVLWITITSVGIFIAVGLSSRTSMQMYKTPTLSITDTPHNPIWNFPFPAVTVCNFNTISKKRAYETARKLKKPPNMTEEKLAWDLRHLYNLIDISWPEVPQESLTNLQNILDDNNVVIEELMEYLAPNCKEMLERCTWKGQHLPCRNLFVQIKTPDGFCCSFNYFGIKNMDYKIKKPRRVAAAGFETALEVMINVIPEDYFATPFSSFGHRVYLLVTTFIATSMLVLILIHYPYDFPDGNVNTMFQSTEGLIFIEIEPSLHRTDENLKGLSVPQRKCLFPNEMELTNFEYTYLNCISECRANITQQLCGCIPFYYNHHSNANKGDVTNTTRICNLQDATCLYKNKQKIQNFIPPYTQDTEMSGWFLHSDSCPCYPDCSYCHYVIEGSAGKFDKEFVMNKTNIVGGAGTLTNQSVFRVFFDDLVSTRYTTSRRHYWHTVLGFFGGVLGIFTGCSIVSLFEMAFFLTIKPILVLIVHNNALTNKTSTKSM